MRTLLLTLPTLLTVVSLSVVPILGGCSGSAGGSGPADVPDVLEDTGAQSDLRTYGQGCTEDAQCETGLCLLTSALAGFGWCTRACDEDGKPCEADSKGNIGGWCAKMPSDYEGEPNPLCLPVCKDMHFCNGLTELWEDCDVPAWKGNPLPSNQVGVLVCSAPSAHGKKPVDPQSCDGWTDNFEEFQTQIGVCRAYCEYLVACKEVPDAILYNKECCAYGCMLRMTPEGVVDTVYDKRIKCYQQNFFSYQGTPQVCTAPTDHCGGNPEDPRPH